MASPTENSLVKKQANKTMREIAEHVEGPAIEFPLEIEYNIHIYIYMHVAMPLACDGVWVKIQNRTR